jgi:hypothetical protein
MRSRGASGSGILAMVGSEKKRRLSSGDHSTSRDSRQSRQVCDPTSPHHPHPAIKPNHLVHQVLNVQSLEVSELMDQASATQIAIAIAMAQPSSRYSLPPVSNPTQPRIGCASTPYPPNILGILLRIVARNQPNP